MKLQALAIGAGQPDTCRWGWFYFQADGDGVHDREEVIAVLIVGEWAEEAKGMVPPLPEREKTRCSTTLVAVGEDGGLQRGTEMG